MSESHCTWSDLKPHSQFLSSFLPVMKDSGPSSGQDGSPLHSTPRKEFVFLTKKDSCVHTSFFAYLPLPNFSLLGTWMWCLEVQQPACSHEAAKIRKCPWVTIEWGTRKLEWVCVPDFVLCKNNPYLFMPH